MRRIPAQYAQPGMVMSRAVYDSTGNVLFERGESLTVTCSTLLSIHGVRELLVDDPRVNDVSVQPLVAPEVEAEAALGLCTLMSESWGGDSVEPGMLDLIQRPASAMARDLCGDAIGEVNTAGSTSPDDYIYFRPVRVAGLALLLGKKSGLKLGELLDLCHAALLMDIGFIKMPKSLALAGDALTGEERALFRKHAETSSALVKASGRFRNEVVQIIVAHHERWDGSGFPRGLKGDATSTSVRILAIADSYYDLVFERPGHRAMMPHEAVEYVMAYGGELFDPELVKLFARSVPLYPTGITVKLNTGEMGIISNGNAGHVGRPVVRLCTDSARKPLSWPIDLDLSKAENQKRLIVQALA